MEPETTEGQSDFDNDASVFKAPLESYREPRKSDKKQSESEDEEPYKEPRKTANVQHVSISTTGQHHKLRTRSTAKEVANDQSKGKHTQPPPTGDSDDDLNFNGNDVRKRVLIEDRKPSQVNRTHNTDARCEVKIHYALVRILDRH